jgi:hypothetical protein
MIRFETINDTLCRMVEPEPLTPDSQFPCLARLIQDDSQMGKYNRRLRDTALEPLLVLGLDKNSEVVSHNNPRPSFYPECYEIIGYPVVEGSHYWALYQMMQGKWVVCDGLHPPCHLHANMVTWMVSEFPARWEVQSHDKWVLYCVANTGWQLYEPKPAKEPEIVAHKQHANCLVCGKEIEGLLDGHATVSIKRYSISSLYESTYSHYCGKCFLELGFDATERELRNRQQPIAEPEPEPQPAKEPIANCDNCKHVCTKSNIEYCHMYEPKPKPVKEQFEVGDCRIEFVKQELHNLLDKI